MAGSRCDNLAGGGAQLTSRPRPSLLVPILAGVLVAGLAMVAVLVISDDDPQAATTTTAPTTIATTTTAPTTTTTAATTTTVFVGGIETVSNLEITGSPGPQLTAVRVGDHDGFVRIVFDLSGEGTPLYIVGYEEPPFLATSGDAVPVDGTAFLAVHLSPARRHDIDTGVPTYTGDLVLEPDLGPVHQIVFVDDFEASMTWVIGLDGERAFTVLVLQDPLRLVVDVAK
jgi:hypothetical protein